MRKPSLKGGLFFIAVWLSFFCCSDNSTQAVAFITPASNPAPAVCSHSDRCWCRAGWCLVFQSPGLAASRHAYRPHPPGATGLRRTVRSGSPAAGATDPRPTQQPSLCLVSLPNRGAVLRRTLVVGGIWRPRQSIALDDGTAQCVIDPDEWEAVRRAAHRQVQRQQLQQTTQPDVHLMADPGDSARPCIIAAFREEHRLTTYFRWRAVGCFLAMALTSGYLLWTSR